MNSEAYAEWLVKRRALTYTYTIKSTVIFLYVIDTSLALTMVWGILILTAIGVATFFVFQGTNLESKYLVVNDQLTIDKIIGRARGKKTWEDTIEEVQTVALSDSCMLGGYGRAGMKTLDFSSHAPGAETYSLVYQAGANTTKVIFKPNDRVLYCLRMRNPRRVTQ